MPRKSQKVLQEASNPLYDESVIFFSLKMPRSNFDSEQTININKHFPKIHFGYIFAYKGVEIGNSLTSKVMQYFGFINYIYTTQPHSEGGIFAYKQVGQLAYKGVGHVVTPLQASDKFHVFQPLF
ncbi:Hypothetical_protein [Hexamita inflata]|uniref:Hypothetical_protein n=1 Tax=Hexamita inflata TaxID=28002 RepID=A0AA86R1N5_9EUKA|nr:Hypothetical protein HINF_LOCUS55107 [Hexamita inflata]